MLSRKISISRNFCIFAGTYVRPNSIVGDPLKLNNRPFNLMISDQFTTLVIGRFFSIFQFTMVNRKEIFCGWRILLKLLKNLAFHFASVSILVCFTHEKNCTNLLLLIFLFPQKLREINAIGIMMLLAVFTKYFPSERNVLIFPHCVTLFPEE